MEFEVIRPEPGHKIEAAMMLDVIFHHAASDEEIEAARERLLEIIYPEPPAQPEANLADTVAKCFNIVN